MTPPPTHQELQQAFSNWGPQKTLSLSHDLALALLERRSLSSMSEAARFLSKLNPALDPGDKTLPSEERCSWITALEKVSSAAVADRVKPFRAEARRELRRLRGTDPSGIATEAKKLKGDEAPVLASYSTSHDQPAMWVRETTESPRTAENVFAEASDRFRRVVKDGGDGRQELKELRTAYWSVLVHHSTVLTTEAIALARKGDGTPNPVDVGGDALSLATMQAFERLATYRSDRARGVKPFLFWFSAILRRAVIQELRLPGSTFEQVEDLLKKATPDPNPGRYPGLVVTLSEDLDPGTNIDLRRAMVSLFRQARSPAQKDYARALVLVTRGASWADTHALLGRRGKAATFRRSARRWAQAALTEPSRA